MTKAQQQDEGPKYSVITTSSAIEILDLPNIISTILLLKDNGLLFTRALFYKRFVNTIENYLNMVFGFNCDMFPVIFGASCINHEGTGFASSILISPFPPSIENFTKGILHYRMMIWEKVTSTQDSCFPTSLSILPEFCLMP